MAGIRKYVFIAATAALLAGCNSGEQQGQQTPPPAVEVAEVLVEPAVIWGDFTGRVAAPESVELRPRVSGYIDNVAFAEGELVKRGDLLFQIDPRPYRARENAAEAQLARARSDLELAQSQAKRAQQLLSSRAISREEFDRRHASETSAQAAVKAAAADLENARLELAYTRVTAPISGRVSRAFITRGNLATANQTLLTTLVSVDPMHVYFESSQEIYAGNRGLISGENSTTVRIGLAGKQDFPYRGTLDFIDNRLNSHTGTVQFRAEVPNPDGSFRPGQFARVQMPTEEIATAVLINRKAVLTDQDRRYVYVVNEKNQVERREVAVGPQQGELVLIRSGLQAGDHLVVNGLQKIYFPGMPVQPELVAMRKADPARQIAGR